MAVPSLWIVGRSVAENLDICGQYLHGGWAEGRATYLQVGSSTAISFRRGVWVIDRHGVGDSVMAVAWAEDNGELCPFGVAWQVWSASAQDFVVDAKLTAIDVMKVAFVGNSDMSGEYTLEGLNDDGAPYYGKGGTLIRYHRETQRWLVAGREQTGSYCMAFADAHSAPHPGFACLKWHVWNASSSRWDADEHCHCLDAPSVIHVLGRHEKARNARICGTYYLAGLKEGRPLYLLPGKKAVIRYEKDRWLIDFDALAEPGILGRLLQWALSTPDDCSAFAEATGSSHPGHLELEWHVWEPSQNRAVLDPGVRATVAPDKLTVTGRGPAEENGDICGDYFLVGLHKGWPAYQQKSTQMVIRRERNRWLIDREGFRDSLTCVAYASAVPGVQHPADGGSQRWHVYENRSQGHTLDLSLAVQVEVEEPSQKRQRRECPVAASPNSFGA